MQTKGKLAGMKLAIYLASDPDFGIERVEIREDNDGKNENM